MTAKQELIKKLLENSSITIEESFLLHQETIQFVPVKEYVSQPVVFQPIIPQYTPVYQPFQPYCGTHLSNNQ